MLSSCKLAKETGGGLGGPWDGRNPTAGGRTGVVQILGQRADRMNDLKGPLYTEPSKAISSASAQVFSSAELMHGLFVFCQVVCLRTCATEKRLGMCTGGECWKELLCGGGLDPEGDFEYVFTPRVV